LLGDVGANQIQPRCLHRLEDQPIERIGCIEVSPDLGG
jgi:hypothetical protein